MVFPEETPLEYMESPRVHVKIFIKNARKQTAAATLVSDLFQLTGSHYKVSFFWIRQKHPEKHTKHQNHGSQTTLTQVQSNR